MIGSITKEPLGVDEVEIIHPFNESLQSIDAKVADMVSTYEHVVRVKTKMNGKPEQFDTWLKMISDRGPMHRDVSCRH